METVALKGKNIESSALLWHGSIRESPSNDSSRCGICHLHDASLSCDLMRQGRGKEEEVLQAHRRVRQGEALFRSGDPFTCLYTVRTGFFKTVLSVGDGREQVTGFHMAGDLLGADAIALQTHVCDAIALEESHVCAILYSRIESLARSIPLIHRQLFKVMSGEIARQQQLMLLLGMMRAEERVAAFLLGLSQRLNARGYSASKFVLRMTRREIGCHLGLKLETVSRMMSKFREDGLIEARYKYVHILDPAGLSRYIDPMLAGNATG